MVEMVMNTNAFPEPVVRLIRTEKVKVNESNGIVNLIPILESLNECPLRGLASDSKLTAGSFYEMTHDEKEIQ